MVTRKSVVVYDIETTGFSPQSDHILQLSAVKCHADAGNFPVIEGPFNRFIVNPGVCVPSQITQLTGITDEMISTRGVKLADAIKDFKLFANGMMLVAHNGKRFDSKFMAEAAQQVGEEYIFTELDTCLLAKRIWPGLPSYSLGNLVQRFELSSLDAHRAENDVAMLVELLFLEKRKLLTMENRIEITRQAIF